MGRATTTRAILMSDDNPNGKRTPQPKQNKNTNGRARSARRGARRVRSRRKIEWQMFSLSLEIVGIDQGGRGEVMPRPHPHPDAASSLCRRRRRHLNKGRIFRSCSHPETFCGTRLTTSFLIKAAASLAQQAQPGQPHSFSLKDHGRALSLTSSSASSSSMSTLRLCRIAVDALAARLCRQASGGWNDVWRPWRRSSSSSSQSILSSPLSEPSWWW